MTDININVNLPDSVDNAIKNVTDPLSKEIGKTLGDCWFLIFGGISQSAEKKRIKYCQDLQTFQNEIEESVSKVPDDIRREPSSQIVLTTLENAKYCVEEKELRDLFTAVLTASIDSTQIVHPSFPHIIGQMSPNDAKMMKYLVRQTYFPICDIIRSKKNSSQVTVLCQNVFMDGPDSISPADKSLAISSLLALGLIEIPSGLYLTNEQCEIFRNSEQYLSLLCGNIQSELSFDGKIVRLSSLGKLFASCCISKHAYGISD